MTTVPLPGNKTIPQVPFQEPMFDLSALPPTPGPVTADTYGQIFRNLRRPWAQYFSDIYTTQGNAKRFQGVPISSDAPVVGQVYQFDGTQFVLADVSNAGQVFVNKYNFTPLAPAQTLAAAAGQVITLNPFPAGISASLSPGNHSLYIVDATHGNEAVLITATNGTSTVTVTCAHIHTAVQWTIGSATGGWQEAINIICAKATGTVYQDPGLNYQIHAQIKWPVTSGAYFVQGCNPWALAVFRAPDYPNGHIFNATSSGALFVAYSDIGIGGHVSAAQTSGACIYSGTSYLRLDNTWLSGGFHALQLNASPIYGTNNFFQSSSHTLGNVVIENGCTDITILGGAMFNSNAPGTGFKITGCDGAVIIGVTGGAQGSTSFCQVDPNADPSPTAYVASIRLLGLLIDQCLDFGIEIRTADAGHGLGGIFIDGCEINGGTGIGSRGAQFGGIAIGSSHTGGVMANVAVRGCSLQYMQNGAIAVGSSSGPGRVNISDTSCQYSGIGIDNQGQSDLRLFDCNLDDNLTYGFQATFAGASLAIVGGSMLGNTTGPINIAGAIPSIASLLIDDVLGITNLNSLVVPAATCAAGVNPQLIFLAGGAGTVNTLNDGWLNRRLLVMNDSGAPITLTGGNFGNAYTLPNLGTALLFMTNLGGGLKWY